MTDNGTQKHTIIEKATWIMREHCMEGTLAFFGANNPLTDTHVFGVEGRDLVDIYTAGQRATNPTIPPEYEAFRLRMLFRVRG